MPVSWNEIRARAVKFSREFRHDASEDAEAKSFWDAFFEVFGVRRRRVASFEKPVVKHDGHGGFIDLLWKGVLLVEHKSRGKDLDRAFRQALDYFPGLADRDLPKFVLVSDFARFRLYDLDADEHFEFPLADLHKEVKRFGFIAGYQTRAIKPEDPANQTAARLMGALHDELKRSGYDGHPLELLLVRLLFCLFAEDTSIFEKRQFQDYVESRTAADGADLGMHLDALFQSLNTEPERRQRTLDELLAAFPYVNGRLFEERLPTASFDARMRSALLDCCAFDWSRISPAIFGSLFQSVMDAPARRRLGAHYTREANILRLIQPLFLDDLRAEFAAAKKNRRKLEALQRKISSLSFLDPACGCGNFLVITYRELRLLELEILCALRENGQQFLNIADLVLLDVDRFHGIEIEEFPALIAQVAMWLTDHQMNMEVSLEFGDYFRRLPLRKSANIVRGDALELDWRSVVAPADLTHLLGNPPFVGSKFMSEAQRAATARIFAGVHGAGVIDFVGAWYRKAVDYMADNPAIDAAFVSTNSITQGEQVTPLWRDLFARGLHIRFAHRTFQWSSEARGKAAVHCVIVGFALRAPVNRTIFEYATLQSEPHALPAERINPYLVDGPTVWLENRSAPLCDAPPMAIGNQPIDGGHYLFTPAERDAFLALEPDAAPFFRRWLGADEFINGIERWCLWLGDCPPEQLRRMPESMKRVEAVREFRGASKRPQTRRISATPTRFFIENMPEGHSLLVPEVSSERRQFIPIGFVPPDILCSNLVKLVPGATLYHFGVIQCTMHMAWARHVCGRLESRYRYSSGIVYNNFPWPTPTAKQRAAIEKTARSVLDARAAHPGASLADLYDPVAMPPDLARAHHALDRAVDAAYGKPSFPNELARMTFLFELHRRILEPLTPAPEKRKRCRRTI